MKSQRKKESGQKKDKWISEELDWRIRVFESLSFPTLVLNPKRGVVAANRVFLQKFGVAMEAVVGKTCHAIFFDSEEPCSSDICPLPKVIRDRKGHSILRQITTETGEEKWEDRVFSPILDDDGQVTYIIESVRDVTQLKTLEKALRETKKFLEKVIQSSASAIIAADRNANILVMNQAAEDLFGYSAQEISKHITIEDLYPPGVAKDIMKKLRADDYGGIGKLSTTKINIMNSNGEEIPAEITAAIIYEEGREVATMGIYKDLREQLAVEKKLSETRMQLAQSEKMASLGQLAAGVAHEINNPLTGILMYASMTVEKMAEDDPQKENMKFIIEDVHRCKDIVQNLLTYSRQKNTSKNIMQLNTLVEESLLLIRDQKLFGNIKIVKELADVMMMVYVDKDQISQVIINLVMNACAAMDGKGTLTLRTTRNKRQKTAYLEVIDTGCGIPKENLSRIFDPFFTTKELGKGTGLGLSTAYGIMQENGGSISVKKTGPTGTSFLIALPLYLPSEEAGSV